MDGVLIAAAAASQFDGEEFMKAMAAEDAMGAPGQGAAGG